jgi:hypothetical protein
LEVVCSVHIFKDSVRYFLSLSDPVLRFATQAKLTEFLKYWWHLQIKGINAMPALMKFMVPLAISLLLVVATIESEHSEGPTNDRPSFRQSPVPNDNTAIDISLQLYVQK